MPTLSNFMPELRVACQIKHPALEINSNCTFLRQLRYPLTLNSSREIARLSESYDLFVAEYLFSVDCWRAGVDYGVYIHGIPDASLLYSRSPIGRIVSILFRKAVADASFVVVSTPNLLRYLKPIRPDVAVVESPIDTSRFNEAVHSGKPESARLVALSLQSLNRHKGIEVIWEAIRRMKNRERIGVLQCDWGMEPEYFGLKESAPDQVSFVPLLPHGRIIEYYGRADIVIGQMKLGILSMIELEAAACGLPVAVFNPDPRKPFLPRSNSSVSLADLLDRLVDDREFRESYSRKCRDYVVQNHEVGKVASRWNELLGTRKRVKRTAHLSAGAFASLASFANQVGIGVLGAPTLRRLEGSTL